MRGEPTSPLANSGPWNDVAAGYAQQAEHFTLPFARRALELAGLAGEALHAVVLDVACGPGTLALACADNVRRVHAVDFAPSMIEQLLLQAKQRCLANVSTEVGDGQQLTAPDRSFHAAFSLFGLMFFPDRARGFRELHRVLRPGGTAVVSAWAPFDQSPLMQLMFGALAVANPNPPKPSVPNALEDPEVFRRELSAAGFSEVDVQPHTVHLRVEGAEPMWESLERASVPLILLRRSLGEEIWAERAALAVEHLRKELPEPRELSLTAWFGIGRRSPSP